MGAGGETGNGFGAGAGREITGAGAAATGAGFASGSRSYSRLEGK